MTRWLVTGARGMLGRDLVEMLTGTAGVTVTAADRHVLDITDADATAEAVVGHDVVVNAAAWTDVDAAEADEEAATRVNGDAVAGLARACAASGAILLQVSTDYVFPGAASRPYPEDAPTTPVNAYGRSKLAGEEAVRRQLPDRGYVVRTAWLYGEHGRNFVATMLDRATTAPHLDVVADCFGQPTWSVALAHQLVRLGQAAHAGLAAPGTYHGSSAGHTTWCGLARMVYRLAGLDPRRIRPASGQYGSRPARRPAYTVLGHARWAGSGVAPQVEWQTQLRSALRAPAFLTLAQAARRAQPGVAVLELPRR